MLEDTCYGCGDPLAPLEKLSLDERLEMESTFRSENPDHKELVETGNKVRLCEGCNNRVKVLKMLGGR